VPNRFENTLSQREGIKAVEEVISEFEMGELSPPFSNRPAVYGDVLDGSDVNFFDKQGVKFERAKLEAMHFCKVLMRKVG